MLEDRWKKIVSLVSFAFQPIVNPNTGVVFGFEALLRQHKDAGFESIEALFDAAFRERVLYDFDLALRRKVFMQFSLLKRELFDKKCTFSDAVRLFYNLDNRILDMSDYRPGNTLGMLQEFGLDQSALCLEISEKHQVKSFSALRNLLTIYKQQGYSVALDDFGVGYSGFELMYHSEPNFIKIDKHYIRDIASDKKRRLYVAQMVRMAHVEGAIVVAEGVESVEELSVISQIGCDLVQGFLIAKPTMKLKDLNFIYDSTIAYQSIETKQSGSDAELLQKYIEPRPPVLNTMLVRDLLERFRDDSEVSSVPVVDKFSKPIGIIEEKKMKKYVYSLYGKEIVQKHPLARYVTSVPIVDIYQSISEITHAFASHEDIDGVIVVKNGEYVGYLSARLLLETIHVKNIESAREENPLTKLPGNNAIQNYIQELLVCDNKCKVMVYVDIDNFKPFNDRFGFKIGDKAILMLAYYLKEFAKKSGAFVGHIGGDDFFVAFGVSFGSQTEQSVEALLEAIGSFIFSSKAFYDKDERKKGCYSAKDRFGEERVFSLLGVSTAIISINESKIVTNEELGEMFGSLKKEAKTSKGHVARLSL